MTNRSPYLNARHYLYIAPGNEFPVSRAVWLEFAGTQTHYMDGWELDNMTAFTSNKYGVLISGRIDVPSMNPAPPSGPIDNPLIHTTIIDPDATTAQQIIKQMLAEERLYLEGVKLWLRAFAEGKKKRGKRGKK